ncbi:MULTISPECIES: hypothetical protein [unclassified Streptomyces]|uniref:hypothetical protein n=1 Tax=unclassified Streptomyces TaxID=2593676 RepID=UPI0035DA10B0
MIQPTVNTSSPNKFKIGLTFKAAAGYDAEWITPTVYGESAEEVAANAVDLMKSLADKGVIDLAALAAKKVRETHQPPAGKGGNSAPKTFSGGRVQTQQSTPALDNDSCQHGRTLREGKGQNGPWAAMFCNAPKGSQCDPLWRQKDGSFS